MKTKSSTLTRRDMHLIASEIIHQQLLALCYGGIANFGDLIDNAVEKVTGTSSILVNLSDSEKIKLQDVWREKVLKTAAEFKY